MHFSGEILCSFTSKAKAPSTASQPMPSLPTSVANTLSDDVYQIFSFLLQPSIHIQKGIHKEIWCIVTIINYWKHSNIQKLRANQTDTKEY